MVCLFPWVWGQLDLLGGLPRVDPQRAWGQLSDGRDQAEDHCGRLKIRGRAPSFYCQASGYHFQAIKHTNSTLLKMQPIHFFQKAVGGQAVALLEDQITWGCAMGWLRKGLQTLLTSIQPPPPPASQLHQFTGNDPTNGKDSGQCQGFAEYFYFLFSCKMYEAG